MDSLDLPPGFRFHPTDEEIITHYLSPKTLHHAFTARPITEADLNKSEPWDLPSKAKMGEKEWYFFCQRDRKYPTGMRTNRATESGYWKATGKDKEIFRGRGLLVGMKKTLVFYIGRAPNGLKTNWVMHEFRLQPKPPLSNYPKSSKKEWVVCRLFHKNTGLRNSNPLLGSDLMRMTSFTDELAEPHTLPPLMEPPYFTFDVKALTASSSPINSYLSPTIDGGDNWLSRSNSTGLCCKHEAPPLLRRHCKPEQVSNQSMLSQDTAGVSTDVASCASYGDLDLPAADGGAAMDLAHMWRC